MRREGTEIAPRLARAIVIAVSAALASIHFAKGVGRLGTDPWQGTGVLVTTAAVFLLQVLPGRRTGRVLAAQVTLALVAVIWFGVSVGLLCLPVGSLLLARRWTWATLALAGAAAVEAARATGVRDGVDLTLTVALGGIVVYGVTSLAALAAEVHRARLTLAMSAVAAERLRIAGTLAAGLAEGLARIRALARAAGAEPDAHSAAPHAADQTIAAARSSPATAPAAAAEPLADPATAADHIITVARASLATARATAADFRSLSLAPEAASARNLLVSAGIEAAIVIGHAEPLGPAGSLLAMVLREAATAVVRRGDARRCAIETAERDGRIELTIVDDGVPTAARGADELGDLPARVREAGGRCRTSLDAEGRFVVAASVAATPVDGTAAAGRPERGPVAVLYGILLAAFFVKALLWVPVRLFPLAVPCVAAVCLLQVHYSVRDAKRGARLGLAALALIAFVPLAWFGRNWIGVPGFLIGSMLIALRFAVAIPLAVVAMAGSALILGAHQGSVLAGCDAAANALVTGLIVYGLLRLARLVATLHEAATALERAAVVQERLRAARDLHDLLGHGLAAIVLKAELAKRLAAAGTADGRHRAEGELRDIAALADRADAELRAVTGEPVAPSFAAELASAGALLAAAEISTEVDVAGQVPEQLATAASAVLREAVTNILRHSAAGHARIALTVGPEILRLDVENDGAPAVVTTPGSGLGGLSIRLAEIGGTLTAGADDGWFVVRAELPVASQATATAASPTA